MASAGASSRTLGSSRRTTSRAHPHRQANSGTTTQKKVSPYHRLPNSPGCKASTKPDTYSPCQLLK